MEVTEPGETPDTSVTVLDLYLRKFAACLRSNECEKRIGCGYGGITIMFTLPLNVSHSYSEAQLTPQFQQRPCLDGH